MKTINIIIGCILMFSVVSCDDFLDVRPKAEKLEGDLFKDADGFESAIYGVYGSLQVSSLYGKDLLWGVTEILAQNLQCGATSVSGLSKYNYTDNDYLRTTISNIWSCAYMSIGYANNVLEQLNNWSEESLPLYNLYKGEMLGVRALLHFDLLRLFASTDSDAEGIPYVTTYSFSVKPFYKVGEVYGFILDDLLEAERLLQSEEQTLVYPHNNENYNKFENYRETHFNLYAVRALLARVYWMKGDMTNAAKYAENVIGSNKFPLVDQIEVKDYLAGVLSPKETIFGIYSPGYLDLSNSYLYTYTSYHSYNPYDDSSGKTHLFPWTALYNLDITGGIMQDYRRNHFKSGVGYASFLKLVDYYTIEENVPDSKIDLIAGVSLIRTSEMYLIAAEALLDTDPGKALQYFNKEISSRGLTPLPDGTILTGERIYNEYRKELFGEGQTWFNMKRLNKDILSNEETKTIAASDKIYVLPIPEEEYEYRDTENGNKNEQ